MDLALLRVGNNRLLRGLGDCKFDHQYDAFALPPSRSWTTAFTATFAFNPLYPTLVFGNYVDRYAPGSPWGTCDTHQLYRGPSAQSLDEQDIADSSTERIYTDSLTLEPGYCTLSMLFTDWNRSGQQALRVTNDRHYYRGGEEQLWQFDSGLLPRLYTRQEGWASLVIWGMGIASADIDSDGFPEYAITSMGDTKLQTLDIDAFDESGWPTYRDTAWEQGATAHRPYTGDDLKPSTGWHAEFDDVNNDGYTDLFITKGNVEQMPDFAAFDPDNLLLGTSSGRFHEVGKQAGLALPTRGRGGAVVDMNMDGQLDIIVVNREAPVSVFRNMGGADTLEANNNKTRPMGNWIQFQLQQPGNNRHAIGATVAIKSGNQTWSRTLQIGGGHASGSLGFEHVGLGVAERAELRIRWPDGSWSAPYRVFANNFVVINRDQPEARYWYPLNE